MTNLAMDVQASDLETLNNLYLMQSLLTNMQTNVYLITQGARGQVIQVNNANLFQLAAQYYGDATLWTQIAQANGLIDPVIQATIGATVSGQYVTFSGSVTASQIIQIAVTTAVNTVNYSYTTQPNDTFGTISNYFLMSIPNSFYNSSLQQLYLPDSTLINTQVSLFLNLVIPQVASTADQGGILEVT